MKALLVDDNEITLELQKLVLEDCSITVETAHCGKEAVELSINNDYDIIFTDINMPDLDGFEVSTQIRCFNTVTPVVALSADEISTTDEKYIKSGMNGVLLKPLEADAVIKIVEEIYLQQLKSSTEAKTKENNDEIFDYEKLYSLFGDEELTTELLHQFFTQHSHDCELLSKYIGAGDFLAARGIMHNLVGVSGNMFCTRLYNAAKNLGAELRQEKSDSFSEFSAIWNETIKVLSTYCSSL